MIGIGLIGTGFMGKCHAIAWNSVQAVFGDTQGVQLIHLGEMDQALADRKAREFGFTKGSGDWRAVIGDPQVDIVSITTPNAFHREMALAALAAGKHVWCEKPMAPTFAEAQEMAEAAARSGKVAILGYNYIQSPAIRYIKSLLEQNAIGNVNHLRIEMDEDFMADGEVAFSWRNEVSAGYGALDDFAVHPLSLIHSLFGRVSRVMCDMSKPYAERRRADGSHRAVETYDIATALIHLENGVSGSLHVNRSAWGRKGRIAVQIFGSRGAILFDQERFNEVQLYLSSDDAAQQGFRTILMAPHHMPYGQFVPAPGHGLGFNDLKIIECHELLRRIGTGVGNVIDFGHGLEIERTIHAMAQSHASQRWVDVR